MREPTALPAKAMSLCEGGTALAFAALAFVSLLVAAMAYTPEYAFHAYLFSAGSVAAVIAIMDRYFNRPAAPHRSRSTASRTTIWVR